MEALLVLAGLVAAAAILLWRTDRRAGPVAAGCALLGVAGWLLWEPGGDEGLEAAVPARVTDGGFVSSATCQACHPEAYAAWHRSFHRTMTQEATASSVRASFAGVVLHSRGQTTRLERRGDEFWAELPDPLWLLDPSPDKPAEAPQIVARVVMTTGSHHLQNYWVRRPTEGNLYRDSPDNGALVQVPWVWLIDEARWVPVQDSFLTPPDPRPGPPMVWNTECFSCHSVATEPHFDGQDFASRSVELGIACEACHGPAEEHVRANQSPLRRYQQYFAGDDATDPTIVNPARLDPQRSAEVCGQCHSFGKPLDMERWKQTGVSFRAGEDLGASRGVFRYEKDPRDPLLVEELRSAPTALDGRFWGDGTMRVAGREYNGMLESACFERGEMTCLSCHSMHRYDLPADQLAQDRLGDGSCLECHAGMRERIAEHTHHTPASEGSRCMNCHMPHTTYGLFVAMRSHRIDNPSASVSAETGRPNACNLCHLDQTLGWTAARLSEWYGDAPVELGEEERSVAASVLWAVRGDAAQRAITAWHMGWPPAQEASGRKWLGAYLAVLLADPYVAIRRVAQGSILTLPGFEGFEFDYTASPAAVAEKRQEAVGRWQRAMAGAPDRSGPALLQAPDGRIDAEHFHRILAQRDNRPLRIIE